MDVLGIMLILSGLFELYCGFNWKYYDRSMEDLEKIRDKSFDPKTDELKCGGFIVQNVFEMLTMVVAVAIHFWATLPYILPLLILTGLPRRWKKNRWWRVTDNFVCAALFFAAAMVVFIGSTENMRVGY
jgi:hypothetical protein